MAWLVAALLGVCGLTAAACGGAAAQSAANWPTKPIRAIVPIAPGTGADVVFRLVFHELSNRLGQQIVVENRGGAGGTIGSAAAAKADPDGYTILAQSTSHTIAPALYPNMPYDVTRDFIAVVPLGKMPTALIVAPSKGIKTVQQLVAEAKAKPGTFTFASAGVGSTTHLTMERFLLSAGITAVHVPFRGGGFRPEVASGRVDFAFSPIAVAVPDVRDGRLLALAVSARDRASGFPEVPTTLEAGYPNSDYALWLGVFLPAKTPRAIVDRLHDESIKALQSPGLRERLAGLDVEPMVMTTAEFDAFIKDEVVAQGALAKAAGLKPGQ
jgi:tripartite-type tricarboxylate transporter receptor subunit TctC